MQTKPSFRQIPLDPAVWGPHYWFFLHTVAYTYPEHPTNVTKRKYYDLIQNMPLFLPDERMGDQLATFLDKYPVSPYLDTRESFMRWVHFIHNKFNDHLGQEPLSMYAALDAYYQQYRPPPVAHHHHRMFWRDMTYVGILLGLVLAIYMGSR
jgi:hypothetical protein